MTCSGDALAKADMVATERRSQQPQLNGGGSRSCGDHWRSHCLSLIDAVAIAHLLHPLAISRVQTRARQQLYFYRNRMFATKTKFGTGNREGNQRRGDHHILSSTAADPAQVATVGKSVKKGSFRKQRRYEKMRLYFFLTL
jgi:hypothetical protein